MTRYRNLLFATLTAAALGFAGTASADVIVKYEMGQAGPQTENFVTGGDITAGADATIDVNKGPASPDNFPDAPVLQLDPGSGSSSTTNALDNGRLFYFDLTVSATTLDLDISSFSLDGAKNGTSARDWGAGFQVDTGSGFGARTDFVSGAGLTTERPDIASFGPYDLSGQAALQNLVAGDVVRFLIAEDNNFTASFDNIRIEGTGTLIPEPASMALMGLGGLVMLRRSRRA